jgi:hypothetical protein
MWLGLNPETASGACEEFDIRIAVRATRGNVMAVVFHQGLVLTLIATSVGVGAALPASRALTTSFCSSVVSLGLMSVAACVIPALRSVR